MKFDKLLKKINKDVLMGIVIGIMLVILACFFGFCYAPKKTVLEGMEDNSTPDSDPDSASASSKSNSNTDYYNTVIGSMNSGCSVHNTQTSCNSNFYMLNNKKHSCKWNITNDSCGFSNKNFSLDDFDGWTHSKTASLTPSSTLSSLRPSNSKPSNSKPSNSSSSNSTSSRSM